MTQFAQTWALFKVDLRKDWVKIMVWLAVLAGIFVAVAAKFEGIYGTRAQINTIMATIKSKSMVALLGPIAQNAPETTAFVFASEMMVFWGIFIIICNFSLAIGSSRAQEEAGVTELILGGYPVGRLAPLSAAAWELTTVDGIFALITGIGSVAANMPGSNTEGDWLFAVVLALTGWSFGMVALVFAQLVADSHLTTIYSYTFFGLFYLVRMMTDVQNPDATWWSPMGWLEKTNIYQANRWLPVLLYLILGLVALIIAFRLNSHRDLNSGLIHAHNGKKGSRFLRGPLSLLLQLQRTSIIAWILGMLILGMSYGSVFNSIGKIVNQSPAIQKVLGASGVHELEKTQLLGFLSVLGIIFSLLAVIAGMMTMNRLYSDERKGYLQFLHTRPVSRNYLFGTYLIFSLVFGAILLFCGLMGTMLAANSVLTHPLAFKYYIRVFWAVLPIVAAFIGLSGTLVGGLPSLRNLTGLLLAISFMISYMGRLMDFPKWSLKLSPYWWVSAAPVHAVNDTHVLVITVIAVILMIVGWVSYRQRDLQDAN